MYMLLLIVQLVVDEVVCVFQSAIHSVQIGLGHCGEQTYLFLKLELDFFAKFVSEFLEVWRLGHFSTTFVVCRFHASPYFSLELVVLLHFAGDDAKLSIADTLIFQGFGYQLIDRVPFSQGQCIDLLMFGHFPV